MMSKLKFDCKSMNHQPGLEELYAQLTLSSSQPFTPPFHIEENHQALTAGLHTHGTFSDKSSSPG